MQDTRYRFEAIGTTWTIDIFDAIAADSAEQLMQAVHERIERFDSTYSRFREDSMVTSMAAEAGTYVLPDDARPLMDMYQKLYEMTDGLVTPLIASTLAEAGYDAAYSLRPGRIIAPPTWEDVLVYDFPNLTLQQPALLDFGAAGKGYLADIVGSILEEQGISGYCIDAGGDMVYRTQNTEKLDVALEHPSDPTMAIGVAKIYNQSICGSSGNRRAWDKYHHIIDPASLESPRHIAALWTVANTGLMADGISTALFFVSPDVLARHFEFEYAIVRSDLSLDVSSGFPATFFDNTATPPDRTQE
ncbi:MAG TPA: FAD:protein FMN transferase [Candidatus Saccharimonadales bacterium]|jgi:thiamine biosynthesis lipoprotein